ncbi:sialate O-acetylesterase [Pedobacter sp.]|uniref:sialate O-acetylesterase n=1 Tax=Pedobacter sp. TaxID=1411316 RepID=UPI003BABFE49
MKKRTTILFALWLSAQGANAQIKFPRLISDGMVLQRNDTTNLWGWASPKEKIKLRFNNKEYHTIANAEGNWLLKLPPQKAGGPYQMEWTASNRIVLKDILFGDVWLCSGQSNMELALDRLADKYPAVIAQSENSSIRQFLVPDEYDFKAPRKDLSAGTWLAANPKNVLAFSGVAYFFALEINKKYQIPIGLINAALGGSPAQSWISGQAIQKFPEYAAEAEKFKDNKLIADIESADKARSNAWYHELNLLDEGIKHNWKQATLNDQGWDEMNIPGYWADGKLGMLNGVVWFRREINIPKSMLKKPAKLLLGRIIDADSVFINGEFAGTTSYQYPPRRYLFNGNLLKEGKNTIVVKVINNGGKGGFVLDKPYQLISGTDTIDLKGVWKYKLGAKMSATPGQTFVRWKSTGLYNAMIAPLQNYRIKGALWYQGEANTGNPGEYFNLMNTLITDWRKGWNQGDFPFLSVQLPNFMEAKDKPAESNWAALRAQQQKLSSLPHVAMAVTIDLGEWNDIHPLNKQDVGHRLALQAEHLVYGNQKLVSSGPAFKALAANGNKLIVSFDNGGSGLTMKDGKELRHFAIAGSDQKYRWAKAAIKGNQVVVWNDEISQPQYIRYAWADNPAGANLFNKAGLPAAPFEAKIK